MSRYAASIHESSGSDPEARAESVCPLFIFSLPRAGSTLLQRILAGHAAIASAAEPWLLLPPVYALRPHGVVAEYGHQIMAHGIREFCRELPEGEATYLTHVRRYILDLYAAASPPGTTFFLDKTPRYSLVAEEIMKVFPDGKFIFLWRNPVANVASILEQWGDGKAGIYVSKIDLFDGLDQLIRLSRKAADRAITVRYEDLITQPVPTVRRITEYLGLPDDPSLVGRFAQVEFEGTHGDPNRDQYRTVNDEPLHKWRRTISNPVRRAWCRHYLNWIGPERLAAMGYDADELAAELKTSGRGLRHLVGDLRRLAFGVTYTRIKERILR